jgi:amylosucrase
MAQRLVPATLENRIFSQITHMIHLRKQLPTLANGHMRLVNTHNIHVLGYLRGAEQIDKILILANFSEHPQPIMREILVANGLSHGVDDLIQPGQLDITEEMIILEPYQYVWIKKDS